MTGHTGTPTEFEIDANGDIVGPEDPLGFGWTSSRAAAGVGEDRRTLDDVAGMPDVDVEVAPLDRSRTWPRVGPKIPRQAWGKWRDGHAPPVAVMSHNGYEHQSGTAVGTLAYLDRLTDALGTIAKRIVARPERSPMIAYDFVSLRRISVVFDPPKSRVGEGNVYVMSDGLAYKFGYTSGEPAARMRGLQTGNPRSLTCLLIVRGVDINAEAVVHRHFDEHKLHLSGEWYDRAGVDELVGSRSLADYLGVLLDGRYSRIDIN